MATIVGIPVLPLTEEQKKKLCQDVAKGVCDAFGLDISVSSMMLLPEIPEDSHGPAASDQITWFVYTAPNKTDDQKRTMVKNVYEATRGVTGDKGKGKVIVIIKEHEDGNCGVDGVWRPDAKKAGTFHV